MKIQTRTEFKLICPYILHAMIRHKHLEVVKRKKIFPSYAARSHEAILFFGWKKKQLESSSGVLLIAVWWPPILVKMNTASQPAAVRGVAVMCIYNWISRSLLDLWTSYITRSVKCAGKLTRPGDGAPSNPASSSRSGGQWANAYCCWKRTSVKFSQFQFSNTPTRATRAFSM